MEIQSKTVLCETASSQSSIKRKENIMRSQSSLNGADSLLINALDQLKMGLAGINDGTRLSNEHLALFSFSQAVFTIGKAFQSGSFEKDGAGDSQAANIIWQLLKDGNSEKEFVRLSDAATSLIEQIWRGIWAVSSFSYGVFLRDKSIESERFRFPLTCSLFEELVSYPFNNKVVDEWFSKEITRGDQVDGKSVEKVSTVKIFNSSDKKFDELTETEEGNFGGQDKPGYWYHGTTHKFAILILEEGIQLRKNKRSQDFSDKDGFYVSPKYDCAKKWAGKKSCQGPAVIVFNVGEELERFKGLDLCGEKEDDWKKVVKYNRCGRTNPTAQLAEQLKKDFDDADYVIGPRSGGYPVVCSKNNCKMWQPQQYGKNKIQLCIKTEELAEVFGSLEARHIEGVIFY